MEHCTTGFQNDFIVTTFASRAIMFCRSLPSMSCMIGGMNESSPLRTQALRAWFVTAMTTDVLSLKSCQELFMFLINKFAE
jgi:hypothetical protein